MTMNNTGLARVFSLSDWHLATLPLGINKSSSKMKNIFGGCCLSIFINLDIHITYYIYISWSSSWVFFPGLWRENPWQMFGFSFIFSCSLSTWVFRNRLWDQVSPLSYVSAGIRVWPWVSLVKICSLLGVFCDVSCFVFWTRHSATLMSFMNLQSLSFEGLSICQFLRVLILQSQQLLTLLRPWHVFWPHGFAQLEVVLWNPSTFVANAQERHCSCNKAKFKPQDESLITDDDIFGRFPILAWLFLDSNAGALAICRGRICLGWLDFRFLTAFSGGTGAFIYLGCVTFQNAALTYKLSVITWSEWTKNWVVVNFQKNICFFCGYYVPSPELNIAPEKWMFGRRHFLLGQKAYCQGRTV